MIYRFEDLDETLDLVPLAARRALDAAGLKVSLAAWRKAPLDARHRVTELGASDPVDAAQVKGIVEGAAVPSSPAGSVPDEPRADAVPEDLAEALGTTVGDETWRLLSALDRWVLAKLAHKDGGERLHRALTEIVVVHEPRLTHLTARGEAHMVDVSAKPETLRRAVAEAIVHMQEATAERLRSGSAPKGDVLAAARLAGIQAAKRTPDLIPLCHVVRLTRVTVDLRVETGLVRIEAAAEAVDRTGVEMEALVAASAAALTVYDMLKGIDRGMTFEVGLSQKHGGASGAWERGAPKGGA